MPAVSETRLLPYGQEQVFDLVADVERYPEFLPWWVAVRVRRRPDGSLDVEQLLALGILRWRFRSAAILERPSWIDIVSAQRPFRRLHIHWAFAPAPGGGCALGFAATYSFRSRRLERIAAKRFDDSLRRTVEAFEARAARLYGA